MEPLRPDVRKAILDSNPNAQPEDIEEYERLLAERFRRLPDGTSPASPGMAPEAGFKDQSVASIDESIARLYVKLFPGAARSR